VSCGIHGTLSAHLSQGNCVWRSFQATNACDPKMNSAIEGTRKTTKGQHKRSQTPPKQHAKLHRDTPPHSRSCAHEDKQRHSSGRGTKQTQMLMPHSSTHWSVVAEFRPIKAQNKPMMTQAQRRTYLQTRTAAKSGCRVVLGLQELDMLMGRVTLNLVAPFYLQPAEIAQNMKTVVAMVPKSTNEVLRVI